MAEPSGEEWIDELRTEAAIEAKRIIEPTKGYLKESSLDWMAAEQRRLLVLVGYLEASRDLTMRDYYQDMIDNVRLSIRHELDATRLNKEWEAIEAKKSILAASMRLVKKFTATALKLAVKHGLRALER